MRERNNGWLVAVSVGRTRSACFVFIERRKDGMQSWWRVNERINPSSSIDYYFIHFAPDTFDSSILFDSKVKKRDAVGKLVLFFVFGRHVTT